MYHSRYPELDAGPTTEEEINDFDVFCAVGTAISDTDNRANVTPQERRSLYLYYMARFQSSPPDVSMTYKVLKQRYGLLRSEDELRKYVTQTLMKEFHLTFEQSWVLYDQALRKALYETEE